MVRSRIVCLMLFLPLSWTCPALAQEKPPTLDEDWKVLSLHPWSRQEKGKEATTTIKLTFSSTTDRASDEKTRAAGRSIFVLTETVVPGKSQLANGRGYDLALKQDGNKRLLVMERPKEKPVVWSYRLEGRKLIVTPQGGDAKEAPVWEFSAVEK